MQNNSKYSSVVIVFLIIIGLVYFFNKISRNAPTEVISNPQGYEDGTTLSLYGEAPASFPRGIILEDVPLTHSSSIYLPDGRTLSKVAYNSEKSLMEVANMYKMSLIADGSWKLIVDSTKGTVATILGTRGTEKLIITIVREDAGASVTFQHEK